MPSKRRYWLMKSEPNGYSIDDLARDKTAPWDGVRNYQARNFMRDEMKVGDRVLFYHSNADPSGVAGIAEVCKESHPDSTAFESKSKYYDPKSSRDKPRWFLVDVKFVEKFPAILPLATLKADPPLSGMMVTRTGARLSIQPVSKEHFERVRQLTKLRR